MPAKVAQIVVTAVLHKLIFYKTAPKSQHSFWAHFVTKLGTKNFQKSPIWSHDKIGLLLKSLGYIFSYKINPNVGQRFVLFYKPLFLH